MLYGSLLVTDNTFPGVLTIVTAFFEKYKNISPLHCLESPDFRELLNLCLTSDTIQANNVTYKQKNGLQMGNSVSGPCAIIFMDFVENQIRHAVPQIVLWKRFIDDCFVIYKDLSCEELVNKCNDIHADIHFTFEEPVNNIFPFLDLSIELKDGSFQHTLFYKHCHSGNVIHWTSHHPRSVLINILNNEMKRAIRNSSNKNEERRSLQLITQRFRDSGYPQRIINNAMRRINGNKKEQRNKDEEQNRKEYLTLPFLSEKQTQDIRRVLHRTKLNKYLNVSFKSVTLSSILKPHHFNCVYDNCKFCQQSKSGRACLSKNCVYFIQCDLCPKFYIGETKRTIRTRLKEHTTIDTSLVYRHIVDQHEVIPDIKMVTWKLLHRGIVNTDLRREIELREIRVRKPDINVQHCSDHHT